MVVGIPHGRLRDSRASAAAAAKSSQMSTLRRSSFRPPFCPVLSVLSEPRRACWAGFAIDGGPGQLAWLAMDG